MNPAAGIKLRDVGYPQKREHGDEHMEGKIVTFTDENGHCETCYVPTLEELMVEIYCEIKNARKVSRLRGSTK